MEHLPGPLVALSPSLEPAFYHAQGIGPVHALPQGARPPPYHHLEGPSQLAYGLRNHKGRHAAEDLLILVFLPCPGLPAGGVMERAGVLAPELPVLDQVIYYHVGPVADPRAALEEVVEHYEVPPAAPPRAAPAAPAGGPGGRREPSGGRELVVVYERDAVAAERFLYGPVPRVDDAPAILQHGPHDRAALAAEGVQYIVRVVGARVVDHDDLKGDGAGLLPQAPDERREVLRPVIGTYNDSRLIHEISRFPIFLSISLCTFRGSMEGSMYFQSLNEP